jgi:hypothetical protein
MIKFFSIIYKQDDSYFFLLHHLAILTLEKRKGDERMYLSHVEWIHNNVEEMNRFSLYTKPKPAPSNQPAKP